MKELLATIKDTLSGKKTYLTSFFMIVFAVSGLVTHNISTDMGINMILTALGLSSLRAGVKKSGE